MTAEAGDHSVSVPAFRAAMRQVPAAVAVITTFHDERRYGLTATAVSAVSAEPPQVLVCINDRSRTAGAISMAGRFGLNYLTPAHESLAKAFAAKRDSHDVCFRQATWIASAHNTPLLSDALVAFDCVVDQNLRSGTHRIFIAHIVGAVWHERDALIYQRGAFAALDTTYALGI